jgi:hypothetical protein
VALEVVEPARLQPIALVAIVAGVVMAAVSKLQGPVALGSLVLFCFGLAVVDGLGKQRFSLRQAVVFLGTIGGGLAAWGIAVVVLLGAVDLPTSPEVQAVLISAGACIAGAIVLLVVKIVIGRRTITPASQRRGRGSGQTGFERGASRGPAKQGGPRRRTSAKSQPAGAAGRGD